MVQKKKEGKIIRGMFKKHERLRFKITVGHLMLLERKNQAVLQGKDGSSGSICEEGLVLVSWLQWKRGMP